MENNDSNSDMFSSSVEVRLWFLTKSKLIDPSACKGLKSFGTSNRTGFGTHGVLDESLNVAEGVMLDEDEDPILDTIGDVMEIDPPHFLDLSQESAREGSLDDDLFWEHSQEEIIYDNVETWDDDSTSSANDDS